jgi:aspartyl aminopeptidase
MELLLIRHALPVRRSSSPRGRPTPSCPTPGSPRPSTSPTTSRPSRSAHLHEPPATRRPDRGAGRRSPPRRPDRDRRRRRVGSARHRVRPRRGAQGAADDPRWRAPAGRVGLRRVARAVPRSRRVGDRGDSWAVTVGQRIAVVCHGGVINTYLAHVLGIDDAVGFFYPNYTSIHRVARREQRRALDRDDQRDSHLRDTGLPMGLFQGDPPMTTSVTAPLDDLICAYLDASPSPHHAAASSPTGSARPASSRCPSTSPGTTCPPTGSCSRWQPRRVAARRRAARPHRGGSIGAHTDSPGLRVKPRPDSSAVGWRQLGVEVYGGVLNNSWLDRDLGVAGRLVLDDGTDRLVDVREPVARVPQLADPPRPQRERRAGARPQQHLTPVWGVGEPTARGGFADVDRRARPACTSRRGGSCASTTSSRPRCSAPTDHCSRAVGSTTSCRAGRRRRRSREPRAPARAHRADRAQRSRGGRLGQRHRGRRPAARTRDRAARARPRRHRDDLLRSLAGSACISADNAHAVHPNYPSATTPTTPRS